MKALFVAVAAAALTAVAPANAGTPFNREVTCPIDGQVFSFTDTMSHSTWGSMLDGEPLASWTMPLPIPQCPDSNFPVYQEEFTDDELATLRTLVASNEYEAIKNESSYYVLRWVLRHMEPDIPPIDDAWILLSATWQVREDPQRYQAYVAELTPLLDAASAPMRSETPNDWIYFQTILANLSRQVGNFDAASNRLESIPGDMAPPELAGRIAMTRELIAAGDTQPHAPARPDSED